MSDSQLYAAIMSHDVDIVPCFGLVLRPVVMSSKAVVFGNPDVKMPQCPLAVHPVSKL